MKNIRRFLTQDISIERIQNVFDLGIQDRIRSILQEPGYDELKVGCLSMGLYSTVINLKSSMKRHGPSQI